MNTHEFDFWSKTQATNHSINKRLINLSKPKKWIIKSP